MATIPSTISYTDIVYKSQPSSSKTNTDFGNVYDGHNSLIAATETISDDVIANEALIQSAAENAKHGLKVRWVGDVTCTIDYTSLGLYNGTDWAIKSRATTVMSVVMTAPLAAANSLDVGTPAADTWYAVYAITTADMATTAGCYSLNASQPSFANFTGYSGGYWRRLGWVRTGDSANIYPFCNVGSEWYLRDNSNSVTNADTFARVFATGDWSGIADTWLTATVSGVPSGVDLVRISVSGDDGASVYVRESGSALATGAGDADTQHYSRGGMVNDIMSSGPPIVYQGYPAWVGLNSSSEFEIARNNTAFAQEVWMSAWADVI